MKIAVVGMGKIGLPLAAQYASRGHTVVGIDVNSATVDTINAAEEPFPGEFGLAEALKTQVPSGLLRATTSYEEVIPIADVVVVVVPLFSDDNDRPDFGWMDSATKSIGEKLSKDTLVIYETTLPIGTTRNRWKPMLEELSGLTEGSDFHVVFSPERVLTGRVFEDLKKYPKLIGGLSEKGAALALGFYEAVLDFNHRDDLERPNGVWDLGSAEAAEMAKLAETTYRDVNIALANEFATHAEEVGVNVYEVIEACNSQPFSHIHRPGISVGGHCIPVYPNLYLGPRKDSNLVRTARNKNLAMPSRAVSAIEEFFGSLKMRRVVIFGATYRSGVKETAFSGAFDLQRELKSKGAIVEVIDPLLSSSELRDLGMTGHTDGQQADCLIVHIDNGFPEHCNPAKIPDLQLIYDGRNIVTQASFPGVAKITLGLGVNPW